MRAAVYTRISRDEAGEGLGVERQQADCEALIARRGWTLAGVYADNDCSAFSGRRRPAYDRLIADVRAGRVGVVVCWAPERLHRSVRELEDFIELVDTTSTRVETVKAGVWDVSSSHGRLVARMLGAVSRAESERIGERVSRAHRQAKERGLWRGPIPYGMRAGAVPGHPEPDPERAGVVEEIYARVLRGDALTRIATELTERGCLPRRGVAWTHTGLLRLMQSPALGGLVRVDGELHDAAFDGVVSAADWHAGLANLARRPRGESRRPRETLTLLGGIMRCATHGHVCVGSSKRHSATYGAGAPAQCYVSIKRSAADELVRAVILERLRQPDVADLLTPQVDHDAIRAEESELRRRRDELAGLVSDGLITAASARPRLEEIASRLAELDGTRVPSVIDPAALIDPEAAWEGWTQPQRREVVRLLFDQVLLAHNTRLGPWPDPTRVQLVWASN